MSSTRRLRTFAALAFGSAILITAGLTRSGLLDTRAFAASAQDDGRREEFNWQGQIQPGQNVEIRGINGPIRAESSSSGQVEVTAIKTAREHDPRRVRIVVVPHAEGVTICALYPDVDGEPNECRPNGGGRNNARDIDVKVEFLVRVPAGATFTGRTVNGGINVKDLDGRASIHTVNGSVELNTTSYGNVKTVNGSITARLGRADWNEALELKTVNGSIELHLPAGVDADLHARTVNGRISSDMPIAVTELNKRSLKGTLGNGGRGLNLETVNGSIELRTGG